ncbi:unannotated protein [freshwater metagenome]|uniref:Unannotated protein n=1 Tax=freshwater metagenome TaxID=449393 RepID=A0A6J7E7B4_9ZZZZ|nr:indolepyruvate ferredoxin oxidoreductase family protein [Actinomycetota bacterium]
MNPLQQTAQEIAAEVLQPVAPARAGGAPQLLTGVQAIVRLLAEQRRLDDSRGLNTRVFISGYPGSPLGGLDLEIGRRARELDALGVVFTPGVNEELAATAVGGTQLVEELPGRTCDGVTGFWYGKAPGLDRAADAIRHGNLSGTTHLGGAVALIGDDPMCKSSTLPSSCEAMAESLMLPLFAPGSPQEILTLGLHAVALSRHAGLWAAMKIVSDVADASQALSFDAREAAIPLPPAESRGGPPVLLGHASVVAEHDLMTVRLERAREYCRQHALNRIVFEPTDARVALVAPGPGFATLRRALAIAGLDDAGLEEHGIRLVEIRMVWPLDRAQIAELTAGVEEVVVVEDKRPFVERQLRDLLYGLPGAPRILGKHDEFGQPLVSAQGSVDPSALARVIAERWFGGVTPGLETNLAASADALPMTRPPFFCSGCPHNLSTRAPDDTLVGAGIGCHSLIWFDPLQKRGRLLGAPQMGGEGAQWIGMQPFTSDPHYRTNMGDGTFHHSGSLAIRSAVAAGLNITYRLLFNDAIAMTGGQPPPGRMGLPELTHWLRIEGVRRTVLTTEDPKALRALKLAPGTEVRDRRDLEEIQQELAEVPGVTVVLHVDRCANEERRMRKRGKLPTPAEHVWINERVCEGCGDCGDRSSCLSVVPVETDFGRKTRIQRSSCTQDLSCLEGDCPSFLLVRAPDGPVRRADPGAPPVALTPPVAAVPTDRPVLIRMPGIGGTGVVTVARILEVAAILDGLWTSGLDQTGLAQKGGAVISDVRIGPEPAPGAVRAGAGEIDLLLGLDALGAVTADTLAKLDPGRTTAVLNTTPVPTAAITQDVDAAAIPIGTIDRRLRERTRADRLLSVDAGWIAERLFSDHMQSNVVMLGAAFQHGCLPVSEHALTEAIIANGAGAERNLLAFAWGRAAALDADAVSAALAEQAPAPPAPVPAITQAVAQTGFDGELAELVTRLAQELHDYQDARCAREYVEAVEQVARSEAGALGAGANAIALAYARGLHKLTAYKDEYEVARLHLDPVERARLEQEFGPGARATIMLRPPLLAAMGLKRKVRVRFGQQPLLRLLRSCRRLRGTSFDPFGRAQVRRVERALIGEYRGLVAAALERLTPANASAVTELAALPDVVRGYEDLKLANVERFRARAAELSAELGSAEGVPAG